MKFKLWIFASVLLMACAQRHNTPAPSGSVQTQAPAEVAAAPTTTPAVVAPAAPVRLQLQAPAPVVVPVAAAQPPAPAIAEPAVPPPEVVVQAAPPPTPAPPPVTEVPPPAPAPVALVDTALVEAYKQEVEKAFAYEVSLGVFKDNEAIKKVVGEVSLEIVASKDSGNDSLVLTVEYLAQDNVRKKVKFNGTINKETFLDSRIFFKAADADATATKLMVIGQTHEGKMVSILLNRVRANIQTPKPYESIGFAFAGPVFMKQKNETQFLKLVYKN